MPPAAWLVNCMQDGGSSQTGATGGAIFFAGQHPVTAPMPMHTRSL